MRNGEKPIETTSKIMLPPHLLKELVWNRRRAVKCITACQRSCKQMCKGPVCVCTNALWFVGSHYGIFVRHTVISGSLRWFNHLKCFPFSHGLDFQAFLIGLQTSDLFPLGTVAVETAEKRYGKRPSSTWDWQNSLPSLLPPEFLISRKLWRLSLSLRIG